MKHAIAFMALILGLGTASLSVADTPISNFIYVDSTAGSDSNNGSASSPVQTLAQAFSVMDNLSDPNNTQIMLRAGTAASPKTYPVSATITWPASAADNIIITSDKINEPSAAQIVGAGDLASGSGSYGLFHIESTSTVNIEFLGIAFNGLKSGYTGGVLSCFSPSEVNFSYCYFFNCSASFGGAIYYSPSSSAASSFETGLEVWCSYFYNCSASDSTFNDGKGGAIKILASSYSASAEVTSTTFENCSADEDGGAVVVYGEYALLYSIANSYYGNSVSTGNGGAAYASVGRLLSYNDMFVNNSAVNGGAVFCENASSNGNESDLVFATLVGNTASGQGGGLAIDSGFIQNAEASIFYNNTAGSGNADVGNGGTATNLLLRYCRVGSTSGLNTTGGNNITDDPAFENASFADLGTLNLNLTADSPCRGENASADIRTGINNLGLAVDARGVARSNGGSFFDMGALEFLSQPVRIFAHGHNVVSEGSAFSLVGLGSSIPGGALGEFDSTRSSKPSLWEQFIANFGDDYDPSIVRLFNWNGSNYAEASEISGITDEGGSAVGAWLITAEDTYVGGADHPIEPQNHYCPPIITIPANSWGLVPNPYFESIEVEPAPSSTGDEPDEGVQIRIGDGEFMDFSRARLYTSQLFEWNASTSTYSHIEDDGTLAPMTSYWLYNNTDQPMTVVILFEVNDDAIFGGASNSN